MDDKCNSADLAIALNGNTKIIATTIQKFPYIVDSVAGLKGKRFAVIIDEAHSSTAGKDMAAVTMSLGSGNREIGDVEDMITDEIRRNGKQANVSMFAFTATPKPTTIQLFGRLNTKGQREAFHIYSMKQAIEEGFILDVLQNYTTYDTFYQLNKEIEEDPRCKTADAKGRLPVLWSCTKRILHSVWRSSWSISAQRLCRNSAVWQRRWSSPLPDRVRLNTVRHSRITLRKKATPISRHWSLSPVR